MYPSFVPQQHSPVSYNPERQAHLSDLISQLPSYKAVNRDQSVFEGPVRLADGRSVSLRITLPPNFPQARPLLGLSHPVQHPWVDQAGQLNFSGLSQWSGQSRLSSVVKEALDALASQTTRLGSPKRPASPADSPSRAATAPKDFPELQSLSTEQLEEVLTNREAFQKLLSSFVDKSQPQQVKKLLGRGNADLAQGNVDKEAEVAELRNQIAIIRSSEYAAAKEAFDSAYARQEVVLAKIKPETLIQALALKATEADEAAEKLVEAFMQKQSTVEAFLPPFIALKKQFHQRELKQQAAEQIL